MACSVQGITNAVVSEDKNQTELNVRKALKASDMEMEEVSNNPLSFLINLIKNTEPTLDGEKVHILNLKREEDGTFVMKYKVGKSNKVIETEVENFSPFMTNTDKFRLDHNHLTRFYSDFDVIAMKDDFEVLALDITNSPEKILGVAQSLIDADTYHNDEAHNAALFQQLGLIKDTLVDMVPNLNVHINNAGKANFGKIDVATDDIYISKGVGGSKSLMEIYVHELYHAVTHFAISSSSTAVRGITRRIEQVRDNFLKNTKEADLIRMSGGLLSLDEAEKLLDHLTDPSVGLHEFVALSMSNKAVMNQLKTLDTSDRKTPKQTLFYKLLDAVQGMYDLVVRMITKEPQGNDLQRMVFLVSRLHEAHKKPLEAKRLFAIRSIFSIAAPIDRKISSYLKKFGADKTDDLRNVPKDNEGDFRWALRMAYRSFFDDQARDMIGNTLSMGTRKGGYSLFKPENTIRTILRDSFEADLTQQKVESLGMASGVIDQKREFTAIQTSEVVLQSFSRPLTEKEEISLTSTILDTDLSSIFDSYDIGSLLENNNNIRKAEDSVIKKLKRLASTEHVNFYVAQTELLAAFMLNHEDNIALLKNARNIAMLLGTPMENRKVSEEVISLIDELASLKALRRVNRADKNILKKLIEEENIGIHNLVAFQFGQKDYAERTLFPTDVDKINMIKGYSAQITDKDIDVTVAPLSKEKELKAQGYILKAPLNRHELDNGKTGMGLYVNNKYMQQKFHRVGMRITDEGRMGTTITESYSKSGESNPTLKATLDIRKMKSRRDEVIKLMTEGKYNPTDIPDDGMVSPVLNSLGKVRDFSYGMNKNIKINLLNMERKVSVVMGRTAASTYDKDATTTFNKEVLELIEEDAAKNARQHSIIGKNDKEYIRIEKDSPEAHVRDLWKILPDNIKYKYKDGFVLRRDLMYSYLGFREMSIIDLPGFKQFFGKDPKAYKTAIKYALQFTEMLWKEMVKITKIDIIIRTPGVIFGNIISNFMLIAVSDYSFKEITALKLQGVKELNEYINGLKESLQLEAKKNANIITKEEERRLNVIKNNLINSPVKDLVDEGFYTTIIEEMEHGGDSGSYFNKLAKKKLNKMPKIFSDGVDLLYITENTKLFKLLEKTIQASDFAARYAQYHLMREKGVEKEKAVRIVRDNFINYNKPNSRFLEYANQMGFVMFTKYFTRIQRVIRDYGKNHPTKVLLSILAQEYVFGEISTFDDQAPIVYDMGKLFYNPWDNFLRVITPSSAEAVNWALNG